MVSLLAQNTEFMWLLGLFVALHRATNELNQKRPDNISMLGYIRQRWDNCILHVIGSVLALAYLPVLRPIIEQSTNELVMPVIMGMLAFASAVAGHVFFDKIMSLYYKLLDKSL